MWCRYRCSGFGGFGVVHIAAKVENGEVVALLIREGADLNAGVM